MSLITLKANKNLLLLDKKRSKHLCNKSYHTSWKNSKRMFTVKNNQVWDRLINLLCHLIKALVKGIHQHESRNLPLTGTIPIMLKLVHQKESKEISSEGSSKKKKRLSTQESPLLTGTGNVKYHPPENSQMEVRNTWEIPADRELARSRYLPCLVQSY